MMNWFLLLNPIWQGVLATLFTWFVTLLGALVVFFFQTVNKKILDCMLGFGSGVMIAASFWSLLSPALELSTELGYNEWLIPAVGFLCGGMFVLLIEKVLDLLTYKRLCNSDRCESVKRSILLVSAVTLHNIPEGMAVGVAFGTAALGLPGCTVVSAVLLAIGIGLQNFPEGTAVSLPLRREGYSSVKSFFYGQASGAVEPVAAIIGAAAVMFIRSILPFLLAFSAGAMISVVAAELIPEATSENKNLAALSVLLGFTVMMVLDVALG